MIETLVTASRAVPSNHTDDERHSEAVTRVATRVLLLAHTHSWTVLYSLCCIVLFMQPLHAQPKSF